jgi:hypothetical protein
MYPIFSLEIITTVLLNYCRFAHHPLASRVLRHVDLGLNRHFNDCGGSQSRCDMGDDAPAAWLSWPIPTRGLELRRVPCLPLWLTVVTFVTTPMKNEQNENE